LAAQLKINQEKVSALYVSAVNGDAETGNVPTPAAT
jgi:hypothetical protein